MSQSKTVVDVETKPQIFEYDFLSTKLVSLLRCLSFRLAFSRRKRQKSNSSVVLHTQQKKILWPCRFGFRFVWQRLILLTCFLNINFEQQTSFFQRKLCCS